MIFCALRPLHTLLECVLGFNTPIEKNLNLPYHSTKLLAIHLIKFWVV